MTQFRVVMAIEDQLLCSPEYDSYPIAYAAAGILTQLRKEQVAIQSNEPWGWRHFETIDPDEFGGFTKEPL